MTYTDARHYESLQPGYREILRETKRDMKREIVELKYDKANLEDQVRMLRASVQRVLDTGWARNVAHVIRESLEATMEVTKDVSNDLPKSR